MENKAMIVLIAILIGAILMAIFKNIYPETNWLEVVIIISIFSVIVSIFLNKIFKGNHKVKSIDD